MGKLGSKKNRGRVDRWISFVCGKKGGVVGIGSLE